MDIFSPKNSKLFSVAITQEAEHVQELMRSDYIKLSWRDTVKKVLPVGSYINYNGIKFSLLDEYTPNEVSEVEFKYEPEFQHPMMVLGRMPLALKTTNSSGEPILEYDWNMTDKPSKILAYICLRLNKDFNITDTGWGFQILSAFDVVSATCTFSNTDYLSALSEICNRFSSENNTVEYLIDWERKQIYLGVNISVGQSATLKVGDNIKAPSTSSSKEGYYNRFIVKGSSRNIWQKSLSGESVSTNTRLALDNSKYSNGYIDKAKQGEPILTKVLVYDEIYPKLDLYAYDVRERNRYLLDDSGKKVVDYYKANGDAEYKTYSVWYIRLAYPVYNTDKTIKEWKDFKATKELVLDGHTLMAAFVANEQGSHSALAGRDFKMYYHTIGETIPKNTNTGDTGVEIKAGDYEINFDKENGDIIIPTTSKLGLIPWGEKTPSLLCDKVVLYNLAMSSEYLASAQRELEAQALKDIAAKFSDNNNYSFKSNPVAFEKSNPDLYIGRSVIYEDINGYKLQTRVTKLITKLDFSFQQEISVGNAHIKGNTQTLKEDVKSANENINILSALNNAMSAKSDAYYRALQTIIHNFANIGEEVKTKLSKVSKDIAQDVITFLKGIQIGKKYSIDENGNGKLNSLSVGEFVEKVSGGIIRMDADGHSYAEVDKLYVRMKAYFDSLEIIKVQYSYGNRIAGRGGVRVTRVEDKGTFYRCYFFQEQDGIKIKNPFIVKDQAIAKDFNIQEGTTEHVANHYLWRAVTGVGKDYVDLSKTNCDAGSDAPLVGDSLCQLGYQGTDSENRDRQNAIMESVVGSGTPSYVLLQGINSFSLAGKDMVSMGFDELNNEAYLHVYGNAYIGARDKSSYIQYGKNGLEAKLAKLDISVGGESKPLDKYIEEHSPSGKDSVIWKIVPSVAAITDKAGKILFRVQKIAAGSVTTFSEQYLLNVEKAGLYAYDGTDDYTGVGKSINVGVEYSLSDLYTSNKYLNVALKSGTDGKVLATLTLNEAGKVTIPDVYSIVTSKRAIDNASDLLTVTVKKNDSSITSQAALQAEGLALYAYDGIDDFSSTGKPVECGSAVRIYDLYKSGKYLNLVLKKGSKIVDVKTLLPVGKSAKVYQYWLDPPVLTVTSDEWGVVQQKGAVTKLYVRNADGTAAHIKVVKYYQSSVYDAGGDCEFVYDFTTYDQGVCEIRITAMKTLYDSTADMRYPVPTASVRMEIEMQDGTKLNTTLTVNVDYSKTSVRFKILEDRIKSTVASVNEKLKSVSKIEQKANEIDLRVKSMGVGRNLLKDTEFTELKNVTGGVSLIADETKKHGGAGGIYINGVGNTSFTGFGFRYKARVEPGTNYIGSVWVMTENASSIDNGLFIEFQSNRDGKGSARDHISTSRIQPSGGGVWERFEFVVKTPANCKQMEMNVYLAQNGVLYMSEPQLERQLKAGDKASPWSPYGGLREAGLNLRDGTFTATGENFLFKLANGTTVLAINEQGKLKAELIEAQEITGEMIAQPFRTYNTGKEFATGKSFSWRITQSYAEFGIITFSSRFDGSNINIYNDTDTEVTLSLLLMREGLQRIVIPARMMLRAQGILHIASNSTRWYMLCPYEAISGGVRLVDFKKS